MSDRDGRVILEQQERQRAPDQAGAADDHRALAGRVDMFAPEQLEDAKGRGWNEGWIALGEPAGVVGVETVDILMWWDLLERLIGIEAGGKRHLDEDAIDRGVVGEGPDPVIQV